MKSVVFSMVAVLALTVGISFAADANNGKSLFESKGKCKTCHKTDSSKLVGPGLAGVTAKYDDAFLHKWIKDPQGTWAAGDPVVEKLKANVKKTGKPKTAMNPGKLNDAEVDDVIAYLHSL